MIGKRRCGAEFVAISRAGDDGMFNRYANGVAVKHRGEAATQKLFSHR